MSSAPARRAASASAARQRPHAAHRHVPAAADHVVEEAAVLAELRIVGRRERPDQPIGQHRPARQIGVERPLEQLGQRRLEQRLPGGVVVEQPAHLLARAQRLDEGAEQALADPGQHGLPRRVAGRPADRRRPAARATRPPRPRLRSERGREQADQIGVARHARIELGEQPGRHGRAAELVPALEHQHRAAGACQQGRGDQRVVAAADDHRVEAAALGHRTNVLGPITSGDRAAAALVCGA